MSNVFFQWSKLLVKPCSCGRMWGTNWSEYSGTRTGGPGRTTGSVGERRMARRRRRRRKRRGKRGDTFLKTRSGVRKKYPFHFPLFNRKFFFLHLIRYRNNFHSLISFFFVISQALLITFWFIFYRSNFNLTFFDLTFIILFLVLFQLFPFHKFSNSNKYWKGGGLSTCTIIAPHPFSLFQAAPLGLYCIISLCVTANLNELNETILKTSRHLSCVKHINHISLLV